MRSRLFGGYLEVVLEGFEDYVERKSMEEILQKSWEKKNISPKYSIFFPTVSVEVVSFSFVTCLPSSSFLLRLLPSAPSPLLS